MDLKKFVRLAHSLRMTPRNKETVLHYCPNLYRDLVVIYIGISCLQNDFFVPRVGSEYECAL